MKSIISNVLLVIMTVNQGEGRIFTKCEFAKELEKNGIPKDKIADWVCLADQQSGLNSGNKKKDNDVETEYGIFQISDKFWCSNTDPLSKGCLIKCDVLLDDNLTDDIACAKTIYNAQNFCAWCGWKCSCKGRDLKPYIDGCGI